MSSSYSKSAPEHFELALKAYEWTYFITADGKITDMSANSEKLTGYSPSEYMENPDLFRSIILPEDKALWEAHFKEPIESRSCVNGMDLRILTKSGEQKYIKHSCQALYDGDVFLGNQICNRDVTYENIIEGKLRYTEESLKKIIAATSGKDGKDFFDSMAVLLEEVTLADFSFIGQTISSNSVQTIALSHEGKLLDNFIYYLEETPCENVIGNTTCIYESGITQSFPKDQLLIDMGIEAYVGTPVFNAKKECIGIIVSLYKELIKDTAFVQSIFEIFAVNIGREMEREKAQQAFLRNKKELTAIYDNAPLTMLLLDNNARVLKMNKRALDGAYLVDGSHQDFGVGDLLHCVNAPKNESGSFCNLSCICCRLRQIVSESFKSKKPLVEQAVKLTINKANAEKEVSLIVSATHMSIEGDETVLLCIEDVTEKSEAKEKIIEQNQKYEALNKNLEEVNHKLRISMEKAASSIKAKDEFLAMMSHEMRTPLNPIMGYAGLMQVSLQDQPYKGYLESILESSSRMLSLIDNILEFSGIQRSSTNVLQEKIEFHSFIEDILSRTSVWSGGDQIIFQKEAVEHLIPCDPGLLIESDGELISKVLLHLLSNACKFSSNKPVNLNIGIVEEKLSSLRLRFEVRDEGIGISQENLEAVFKPFVQADSSLTRSYEGIGMGLAICKKLIALLDGEIGVESVLNEGSLFWFEIPVKRAQDPSIHLNLSSTVFSQKWNVLVAEDQIENQQFFKACIAHLGGVVTIVDNGEEALKALDQNSYDVILMDIRMPVMDGIEACKIIRSQPVYSRIPIIALSAHKEMEVQRNAAKAGMDEYLSKPVNMAVLADTVNRLLDS